MSMILYKMGNSYAGASLSEAGLEMARISASGAVAGKKLLIHAEEIVRDFALDTYCIEMCPGCGNEEVIFAKGITRCPDCGYPMAPCSVCREYRECDYASCPYGCNGTDDDGRKKPTNPDISREETEGLYPLL